MIVNYCKICAIALLKYMNIKKKNIGDDSIVQSQNPQDSSRCDFYTIFYTIDARGRPMVRNE